MKKQSAPASQSSDPPVSPKERKRLQQEELREMNNQSASLSQQTDPSLSPEERRRLERTEVSRQLATGQHFIKSTGLISLTWLGCFSLFASFFSTPSPLTSILHPLTITPLPRPIAPSTSPHNHFFVQQKSALRAFLNGRPGWLFQHCSVCKEFFPPLFVNQSRRCRMYLREGRISSFTQTMLTPVI